MITHSVVLFKALIFLLKTLKQHTTFNCYLIISNSPLPIAYSSNVTFGLKLVH